MTAKVDKRHILNSENQFHDRNSNSLLTLANFRGDSKDSNMVFDKPTVLWVINSFGFSIMLAHIRKQNGCQMP